MHLAANLFGPGSWKCRALTVYDSVLSANAPIRRKWEFLPYGIIGCREGFTSVQITRIKIKIRTSSVYRAHYSIFPAFQLPKLNTAPDEGNQG